MPVQGIASGPAAFSQAEFQQLKQQVMAGTARKSAQLHEHTDASSSPMVPPIRTQAGGGGEAVWMFTPQSAESLYRSLAASGYPAVSLGDAWPQSTYEGHMLNGSFRVLDPAFGGLKADYRV